MYYTQDAVKDANSWWSFVSLFFAFGIMALGLAFGLSVVTMLLDQYTVQLIDTHIKSLSVIVFWGIVSLIFAWRFAQSIIDDKRTNLQKAVKFRCSECKSEDLRFDSVTIFEPIVQQFMVFDVNTSSSNHWCRGCVSQVEVECVPLFPELQND